MAPEAAEQAPWAARMHESGLSPGDRLIGFVEPSRVDRKGRPVARRPYCCDVQHELGVSHGAPRLCMLTFGCKYVFFGFELADGRVANLQVRFARGA